MNIEIKWGGRDTACVFQRGPPTFLQARASHPHRRGAPLLTCLVGSFSALWAQQANHLHAGWSLWLVPPADSPLNVACDNLINSTLPTLLPTGVQSHPFAPHVTLSSHIPASTIGASPQDFLGSLRLDDFQAAAVEVRFAGVKKGTAFFKKVYLQCERDAGLVALAARCRAVGVLEDDAGKAAQWAESEYDPHFSLV